MGLEAFSTARALRCVANGRVMTLSELRDGVYSHKLKGDGYAVLVRRTKKCDGGMAGVFSSIVAGLFAPSELVELCAPADGVVTAKGEALSLRTGDGIEISVYPEAKAAFHPEVGEKVRRGRRIGTVSRTALSENPLGGAVVVVFSDMERITELHVSTGRHRTGERTAFYHIRRI